MATPDHGSKSTPAGLQKPPKSKSVYDVSFPAKMEIYLYWSSAKHFFICSETEQEKLFCVEIHLGYSKKGYLGHRPGYYLHGGPSPDDPVVAAIGYESIMASRIAEFNSDSIVVMPPYDAFDPYSMLMTLETMEAHTTPDRRSVFAFSIQAGKRMLRERFEWRQVRKGEDSRAPIGGFKLVRAPANKSATAAEGAAKKGAEGAAADGGAAPLPPQAVDDSPLAIFSWTRGWFGLANIFSTHPFSLEFVDGAEKGPLGGRWALMVVVTALWMDNLHKMGRTNYWSIRMGELLRGTHEAPSPEQAK